MHVSPFTYFVSMTKQFFPVDFIRTKLLILVAAIKTWTFLLVVNSYYFLFIFHCFLTDIIVTGVKVHLSDRVLGVFSAKCVPCDMMIYIIFPPIILGHITGQHTCMPPTIPIQ